MFFKVLMEGFTASFSIWLSIEGLSSTCAASSRRLSPLFLRNCCTFAPMLISSAIIHSILFCGFQRAVGRWPGGKSYHLL